MMKLVFAWKEETYFSRFFFFFNLERKQWKFFFVINFEIYYIKIERV